MTKIIDNLNIETKTKIIHEIDAFKSLIEFFDKSYKKKIIAAGKAHKILKILDDETDLSEREKKALTRSILETVMKRIIYKTDYQESRWWEKYLVNFWTIFSWTTHEKDYLENAQEEFEHKRIEIMEEDLEEQAILIKELKKRAERGEEDAEIHFKALTEVSKEWNERRFKSLENQISDKAREVEISKKNYQNQTELLIKVRDNLRKEEEKNKELQKKSEEEKQELLKLLEKTRNKLKEQEEQNQKLKEQLNLHSNTNFLTSKKRKKEEFESQHIEKKIKVQNQTIAAQIEVKRY